MALHPHTQQLYRAGNSRNEFAQDLDWLSAVSQRLRLTRTPIKRHTALMSTLVPSGSVFNTHSCPVPDIRTVVPCMPSTGGGGPRGVSPEKPVGNYLFCCAETGRFVWLVCPCTCAAAVMDYSFRDAAGMLSAHCCQQIPGDTVGRGSVKRWPRPQIMKVHIIG